MLTFGFHVAIFSKLELHVFYTRDMLAAHSDCMSESLVSCGWMTPYLTSWMTLLIYLFLIVGAFSSIYMSMSIFFPLLASGTLLCSSFSSSLYASNDCPAISVTSFMWDAVVHVYL